MPPVARGAARLSMPPGPIARAFPAGAVAVEVPSSSTAALPTPSTSSASATLAMARGGPIGSVVALAVYMIGVCCFVARSARGWRATREIMRGSHALVADERLSLTADAWRDNISRSRSCLRESAAVVTPMTLGLIAPVIILPMTWRRWPDDALRAVLSHESAHLRRRDPLVNHLAHLNRCVFWFHPVAWWLTHKLAVLAEHACDDAGVRAVGDGRRYAAVLIEMAARVQRNGGRLSWHGVGIDGNLLSQRIDRVISGHARPEASVMRTWGVAVSCVASVVLVVACRPQPAAPPGCVTLSRPPSHRPGNAATSSRPLRLAICLRRR